MSALSFLGSDLPSDWDEVDIAAVTLKVGSGATPRGGSSVYINRGTSFIRSQNVYDHEFRTDGLAHITEEAADQLRGVTVESGDVLLNITGDSILRTCMAPESILPARVNQHVAIIRSNGRIDPRFLQKWLSLPAMKEYMLGHSSGGTRKAVTKGHILSFPVPLPPVEEQHGIAATLGVLDDKIESNRRAMVASSELVAALAARLLETTDTVECALSELVTFNRAVVKPGSTERVDYIDIASVSPGRIDTVQSWTWDAAPSRARRGVADGDVIYSTVRPGRRSFALVIDPSAYSVASTGFAVMSPTPRFGSSLLTVVAGSYEFAEYLESVAHGSAYPAVSIDAMGKYTVTVPSDAGDRLRFEELTMPLRRRAAQLDVESSRLTALRDALLPELLSGRVRAAEAEGSVEEVFA